MRFLSLVLLAGLSAAAKPMRKAIPYTVDGRSFEGVLVFDDAVKTPRPGLLMVPNWLGVNEANLQQAERVAGKDYVLFVADVYGKGAAPKTARDAPKMAGPLKADRKALRARAAEALKAFLGSAKEAGVDPRRVAAIGFCFGGTTVIELARAGADLTAVISFHGGLDAPAPTEFKPRARVLALHGAEDPTMSAADVKAFKDDMRHAGADWTLVELGGAVHSFTDVDAKVPGRSQYDERAASRSYRIMRGFLEESFGAKAIDGG